MDGNLFAACGARGNLTAARIPLSSQVQTSVLEIFRNQEQSFIEDVTGEVPFDGGWKPDEDEILTIDLPDQASVFTTAISANAISIPRLDLSAAGAQGVKALFTGFGTSGESTKILVQRFTLGQMLSRRFALLLEGNTFRRLTEQAFTIDTSLACIIEDDRIKFKSFHKLRSIFDMTEVFREATDSEIRNEFVTHPNIAISDTDALLSAADITSRKLIREILTENVLGRNSPGAIQREAESTGLSVTVSAGKLHMPTERRELKSLLLFLTDRRFSAPLSGINYVTNSRRPVQ